ncbi:SWI/SNF-related matrix-associated actin-dependent regulator of chromatin subfamily A-like protein 1 [Eupeodes corollae]|uniref:SWI/SNF-related matrix-associated actin-dependent regulator of chromatin subfamily A-like protein 1 n=1 Tax=Eupeodes corollae TaxID=290404 RepID=UPI00248F5AE7|nr:SWI/SNF-related matrix-associated actin-dependent regulator of chromatin subfamily A-like protein 1 [Eupeodes corollae]
MSTCSAAEIAEKKRIALEKLKAKKNQISNKPTIVPNKQSTTTSVPALQTSNQLAAPHSKPSSSSSSPSVAPSAPKIITSPVQNFYKSNTENKASDFLKAIKQSSTFANRNEARNTAHPYSRPSGNSPQQSSATKGGSSVFKNALMTDNKTKIAPVFVQSVSCTCYLISAFRFAVQPSGYHTQLIEVFKSIPSKAYDNNTKIWSFSVSDYQLLQDRCAALKPYAVIGIIPKNILKLCQTPVKEPDPSCLASIEPTLVEKLLPFQKEGVVFGISKHGRVMIGDEMGLGKTYQALAIADFYREDWPLFICTTASTRDSWAKHVQELLPSVLVHNICVLSAKQQYTGDAKVLITSYNLMEKSTEMLLEKKFGVLILDESHTLKNSKAKCTVVADRLSTQARRVILLSGTPALSRPLELFSQLQMIDRRFFNFIDYTSRYCAAKQTNFGWDASGQSNLPELNVVLKLKFMVRRIKADVLPQLAEKTRETVVLDPALLWHGSDVDRTLQSYTNDLSKCKGKERECILLKFYAETATVKARAVCEYLKTLIKQNLKFIVFAHHKVMMEAISESLDKQKVKYIKIDGNTKSDLRSELVEIFQNKSSCKVALLSLKACNSGITLTAADTIVFAELDWNPSTLAQAESRAHRIGQKEAVTCKYLMANKTADDIIWNMLKEKQDVLNKAGLFSEDLQDATHSSAPSSTRPIESYMTPIKKNNNNNTIERSKEQTPISTNIKQSSNNSGARVQVSKRIEENFEELFDEDDDAFKDLDF